MMKPISMVALFVVLSVAIGTTAAAAPEQAAPTTEPTTRPDMTPRISENSIVARDMPFAGPNSTDKQRLDVYAPRGANAAPVVVFIHGGEWTKGDKSEVSFKPKYLNENGVIFIAANYRLSGTDKHPAQVDDVATAVKWVRDHVPEFGGDPKKIVLMGHSAGCHLVTLATLDPRILARVGMKPSDLAGVVSWSGGAFDLVDKVKSGGMYATYIRANFTDDESAWRDASPMNHIGDSKQLPPFRGNSNTARPVSMRRRFSCSSTSMAPSSRAPTARRTARC